MSGFVLIWTADIISIQLNNNVVSADEVVAAGQSSRLLGPAQ